jgi:hypothetical protein
MSIDAVYVLPCGNAEDLAAAAVALDPLSVQCNGAAALVASGHNAPPDASFTDLIADHAELAAPMLRELSRLGCALDERGVLCIDDLEPPPSLPYGALVAAVEERGVWLPLPPGVRTQAFPAGPAGAAAQAPEADQEDWALLVAPGGSPSELLWWDHAEEVLTLKDGGCVVTVEDPCTLAQVASWVSRARDKKVLFGETPPAAFLMDHLDALQSAKAATVEAIRQHLGAALHPLPKPRSGAGKVKEWKRVKLRTKTRKAR